MIKGIKKFTFNPFSENTYLVWDENTLEGMIVDPGMLQEEEEKEISSFIERNNITIKLIVNTHCHLDHIFGNSYSKNKYSVPLAVPRNDVPILQKAPEHGRMFGIELKASPPPDLFLDDLQEIIIGELKFELLFTPGHTPGEYCLYNEHQSYCLTGDVLFEGSIGRTDLWGGNLKTLLNSIESNLLCLPDNTVILPGHGGNSTIANEKKFNPYLQSS